MHGSLTYDVLCKENFQMQIVLMEKVTYLQAYGMLFGWTTHGTIMHVHISKIAQMLSN